MSRLPFLLFLSAALAVELPMELPELTTKQGKKYEAVVITEKRPDGISIRHAAGTARVPFESLPDDLVKTLGGFDGEAAKKARSEADRKEASTLEAIEKGLAKDRETKGEKKQQAEEVKAASPAVLDVVQALESGALCRVSWVTIETRYKVTRDAFGRDVRTPYKVPVTGEPSNVLYHVENLSQRVDGDEAVVLVVFTGENHVYTNAVGSRATVRKLKVVTEASR